MNKKHHDQGFSVLELLVIIFALGLLVGVSYYGYKRIATKNGGLSSRSGGQMSSELSIAHDTFGLNLFNELIAKTPLDDNVFISPTSISMALSMAYNGANSTTKQEMQQVLAVSKLSSDTVNSGNLALLQDLTNPDPNVTLSIANSIWLNQGHDIHNDFLNTIRDNYNASAKTLDFRGSDAVDQINSWVNDKTKGKIPTILDKTDPNGIMYLINAVYFKGSWHNSFDTSSTEEKTFTLADGTTKQHPLMLQDGTYQYFERDGVQAIQLPYGKAKRLTMDVYLPEDMKKFTKEISYNKLSALSQNFAEKEGTILLPKLRLDYAESLNDALKQLGMNTAFEDSADFSAMSNNAKISEVLHKTFIDINEEGTDAAAVTSVGMTTTTSIDETPSDRFYMEVNKPYVFTIRDTKTQEIIFIGLINNPTL